MRKIDNPDLTPAIGYIRVSMAREEMISPELQQKAIEQWAAATGHRIIDWVPDLDKTGRNFKRKIMQVIERVEAAEASVIAVWKYSRFGRTRDGCATNLARVERAGGQLHSATEPIDASTAIGKFQRGMIMEFNAYESDRAGEQWKETHTWRIAHGLPSSGGRRFGYIWHPRCITGPDGSLVLQQERYEPDPDTRKIVESLFRRYADGEGFQRLANWLNDRGIRNTRGATWSERTLAAYMDSGFAAGYLRVHDDQCREPYRWNCPRHLLILADPQYRHAAIVDADLWARYQRRRSVVRVAPPRTRRAAYPLTGVLACQCGNALVARRSKPGARVFFTCSLRRRKGPSACGAGTHAMDALEKAVLGQLRAIADEVDQAAGAVVLSADDIELQGRERVQAEEAVKRAEKAINRHLRAFALIEADEELEMPEEEFLATLKTLRTEKATAVRRVEELSAGAAGGLRVAAVRVARGLLDDWPTAPPELLNTLLRQVFRKFYVLEDGSLVPEPVWVRESTKPLGL